MQCSGWAVIKNGVIDVATVSDTRRNAIINWMAVHTRPIYVFHTDSQIEQFWKEDKGDAEVVRVTIAVTAS